ncbi:MAG: hypothetical protein GY754_24775 [bacterium]|nr:hypothetical protein [bacterium]
MGENNSHSPFHDLIFEKYIFHEIDPENEIKLEEHLAECTECRSMKETILRNNRVLASEPMPEISPGFKQNLLKKLDTLEPEQSRSKKRLFTASALRNIAAFLPLLIAMTFVFRGYIGEIKTIQADIMSQNNDPAFQEFLHRKKRFHKEEYYKGSTNANYTVQAFLEKNNIEKETTKSDVYIKPVRSKVHSKKGGPGTRTMFESYILIETTKKEKKKIEAQLDKLEKNIESQKRFLRTTVIIRTKPGSPYEGKPFYLFIALISLEVLIRIFLMISVKKSTIQRKWPLYSASLILGSIFIPVYILIRLIRSNKN